MIVNLYGFQKKKNSTKRPSGAATQLSNVNLKDDTSVLNPVLLINQNSPGMPVPFDPSHFAHCQIWSTFIPDYTSPDNTSTVMALTRSDIMPI